MDIIKKISEELEVKTGQVEAAVTLLDEGCTVPFIARYRKEKTGALNDEQLRHLAERLEYLRALEEKKETIIKTIEEQGKLTPELKEEILSTETQVRLEDLYRPYRPKRKTRASVAREAGLQPLADLLVAQQDRRLLSQLAEPFVDAEKGIRDAAAALAGASDIIAEGISDNPDYRVWIREKTEQKGILHAEAKDPEQKSVYETYYQFSEAVAKISGYRVLAINRGEKEKILTVRVEAPEEDILRYLKRKTLTKRTAETEEGKEGYALRVFLENAVQDAYSRLILPAVEREIRSALTEKAEDSAIDVFGKNLTQLLMQPPIAGQTVLGWDPAFRTGCKLCVVDPTGKVLDTAVIYPTAPTNERKIAEAKATLKRFIKKYGITLISCGNGTASRESEQIIVELLHEIPEKVSYVITNEAGASVYSASALATEEFPQFDVGQRSAASIARRVQDPLAELVKIDPRSIGVGQYQHDMDQKKLGEALGGVVETAVNRVGVDLNTASVPLLTYVSGITRTIAKNIVTYREEHGGFRNRKELLSVPKLGPKAFEQCAGFLRISGGENPLDATAVHPESYSATEKLLQKYEPADLGKLSSAGRDKLAEETGMGRLTLDDIIEELLRPGRDPREDMPKPILRSDVMEMKDLTEGMILKGTVRNVIDFGAFVDIGVHQDGLVHISKLTDKKFVKHPLEVVSVGDIVDVKVIGVDPVKGRISLSMIL